MLLIVGKLISQVVVLIVAAFHSEHVLRVLDTCYSASCVS